MDNEKQSVVTGPAISESLVMLIPNAGSENKDNITIGKSMAPTVMEFYSNIYPWFGDMETEDIENALYEDIEPEQIDEENDDSFRN